MRLPSVTFSSIVVIRRATMASRLACSACARIRSGAGSERCLGPPSRTPAPPRPPSAASGCETTGNSAAAGRVADAPPTAPPSRARQTPSSGVCGGKVSKVRLRVDSYSHFPHRAGQFLAQNIRSTLHRSLDGVKWHLHYLRQSRAVRDLLGNAGSIPSAASPEGSPRAATAYPPAADRASLPRLPLPERPPTSRPLPGGGSATGQLNGGRSPCATRNVERPGLNAANITGKVAERPLAPDPLRLTGSSKSGAPGCKPSPDASGQSH